MSWILAMALSSNPDGLYVRNFATEQECVAEMNRLVKANASNPLVDGIACLNKRDFALNGEVKRDRG